MYIWPIFKPHEFVSNERNLLCSPFLSTQQSTRCIMRKCKNSVSRWRPSHPHMEQAHLLNRATVHLLSRALPHLLSRDTLLHLSRDMLLHLSNLSSRWLTCLIHQSYKTSQSHRQHLFCLGRGASAAQQRSASWPVCQSYLSCGIGVVRAMLRSLLCFLFVSIIELLYLYEIVGYLGCASTNFP